ncbi:MAG: hypothetical protein Ct9H300mP23_08470 [Nitrospinota bacterium]|nr:MAG: hypothetical protein Ct9H300mP23_08470 [Nitrospinota bacterium]
MGEKLESIGINLTDSFSIICLSAGTYPRPFLTIISKSTFDSGQLLRVRGPDSKFQHPGLNDIFGINGPSFQTL